MSKTDYQKTSGKNTRKPEHQEHAVAGFENLWVWQKSHQLMLEVHDICRTLPATERFNKRSQLERSSSSVPDNIAEGHTSFYYQDKIKCFQTARKESGETQNHIMAIRDKGYLSQVPAQDLIDRYEEIIRGINGYIRWVRTKRGDKK